MLNFLRVAVDALLVRCIRLGSCGRLGLCRFEDDLDAKLMQVGVDLLKVAGGFIGEHEDKQQEARMTGRWFLGLLQRPLQ